MNRRSSDIDNSGCGCNHIQNLEVKQVVESIIAFTGTGKEKVIPILQEIQKKFNYLPEEALRHVCRITDITPGQLSGVATFYSQFRHEPSGSHTIRVCTGTACHVKGSSLIIDAFRRFLKIKDSEHTSPDKLFTIEEVACLGCCTLAPVVQIDGKTYGHVNSTQPEKIIKDFLERRNDSTSDYETGAIKEADAEVRIGVGSCCVAGGSKEILSELISVKEDYDLNITIKPVGCVGVCNQTPLLEIVGKDNQSSRYTRVHKEEVEEILLKHLMPRNINKIIRFKFGDIIDTFQSDRKLTSPVNLPLNQREQYLESFLSNQVHIATACSGIMEPDSFDEYSGSGGFIALRKCLKELGPDDSLSIIRVSGLRGRGGGGFPAGKKWEVVKLSESDTKYVICNGDEGDPGAFMDRMLLESFPYRIIEGMVIAGYATGAAHGIFYIRAEYPLAVSRVRNAINRCYEKGILGNSIFGSGFSFNAEIFEGAGAFVCGEETALIASLEGGRGTPHLRPPYPAVNGYYGCPTLVNNVETLAAVPWIINNGPEAFSTIGTDSSKGTKVFALAGKVARGGLIEVPMGITIREIVENIGGGVAGNRKFKAVQVGGPSGGCIPESMADSPIDYEELNKLGAMMGSGGLVVLDDSDCMVDIARYFLQFTHRQSCGKCTFCRAGTRQMLTIVDKLTKGEASLSDLDELENLAVAVKNGSLCGLGRTAPNPVLTGLKYFRDEYEAHTRGVCPAGKCSALIRYSINDKCTGCTKCAQECPVKAIPFTPYEKHVINDDLCTKCDSCRIVCPENAIEILNINGKN
ncbi:MAG: NAD(P)H-dependent oxidoreductase subunit E [Bacteroidales bacterium]|nr:NAD(P)H-dependent oxidoreductase subunit E [Bacteroidales bacterium]